MKNPAGPGSPTPAMSPVLSNHTLSKMRHRAAPEDHNIPLLVKSWFTSSLCRQRRSPSLMFRRMGFSPKPCLQHNRCNRKVLAIATNVNQPNGDRVSVFQSTNTQTSESSRSLLMYTAPPVLLRNGSSRFQLKAMSLSPLSPVSISTSPSLNRKVLSPFL